MKSTKLASLGLAALMGISVLAGCGGKKESNTTASDSKEVTLTVWTPSEDQSEEQGNWLKKQLDEVHPRAIDHSQGHP